VTLEALLRAAENADGLTRMTFRDPIAAFGAPAIERLAPWLLDRTLGAFAVRTIERAAAQAEAADLARSTLRRARGRAPALVEGDIAQALARMARARRPPTQRQSKGSPDGALIQLRDAVASWRRRGSPPQPGIAWPHDRWRAVFPAFRDLFGHLPAKLDRTAIAAVARGAPTSELAALEALVAVMVWGHGDRPYAQFRGLALLAQPAIGANLQAVAAALESKGALAAYRLLAGTARIEGLGPSFGTKFLYFAQPPTDRPRSLIHDRVIGTWLVEAAGLTLKSEPYSVDRYGRYLRQMQAWAEELACEPDEVEMCIFRAIQPPGSQWA
jgi:hypothetical protein